ncbi:MAG TPA: hypothetical protein VLD57_10365, partial [Blastocatellia bacterium]|nr:hypothetical protein [Blastocatellia bacterium]
GTVQTVEAQTMGVTVLDVAIDGRTFRGSDGLNPFDPGPPNIVRGNTFIVSGKVYPGGTIPEGTGVFGPDEPGSIGNWTCRGTFINPLDSPLEVDTTQLWEMAGGTFVTEGLEGAQPTIRVVIGGTGSLRGISGEVLQQRLGTNVTGDLNLRFTYTTNKKPR